MLTRVPGRALSWVPSALSWRARAGFTVERPASKAIAAGNAITGLGSADVPDDPSGVPRPGNDEQPAKARHRRAHKAPWTGVKKRRMGKSPEEIGRASCRER